MNGPVSDTCDDVLLLTIPMRSTMRPHDLTNIILETRWTLFHTCVTDLLDGRTYRWAEMQERIRTDRLTDRISFRDSRTHLNMREIVCLIDGIHCLIDWLIDWLTDWLMDWYFSSARSFKGGRSSNLAQKAMFGRSKARSGIYDIALSLIYTYYILYWYTIYYEYLYSRLD